MASESYKEYTDRLKSVPWVHRDPTEGFIYGCTITPPFENAIPFYSRYGGVDSGRMGATVLSNKEFITLEKPGLFKKKNLNGTLFWAYAGKNLSMRIDRPINVKTYDLSKKQYINLENFQASLVLFIKSWDCHKLAKYIYDNKLYDRDLTLFDLADYVNKSFQKVMEEGFKQGVIKYINSYGKTACVIPSFHGLDVRNDKNTESYKQSVREKLFIVNGMNKALKDIGAENGGDDVINIADHMGY